MSRATAKKVFRWVRYPLAALPILWIFWRVDLGQFARTVPHVAWWTVPSVAALALFGMALQGVRWWMLLRAQIPDLSFGKTMACHFAGLFYGIVLPSSAGQDLIRAVLVSRDHDYGIVWGATWICRLLGLLALAGLSITGFFWMDLPAIPHVRAYALGSIAVLCLLVLLSFTKTLTRPVRLLLQRVSLVHRVLEVVKRVREGVYLYRKRWAAIGAVLVVTAIMQISMVANASILIKGITGDGHFAQFLIIIPLVEIACLTVPLTPNGIGIREGLMAVAFKQLGISNEQLGIYVIIGFLSMALRLVGVFFVPFVGKRAIGRPQETVQPDTPQLSREERA